MQFWKANAQSPRTACSCSWPSPRTELHTFFEHCRSLSFDQKPNYDHFYDLFGKLILREGFQLDMAFDWDVAGGKSQPGCTDKSVALQHERNHSPKRITLYVPCILSTHYSINISLHSDNGLYADCALSMAR
jgi:hypothetical protein